FLAAQRVGQGAQPVLAGGVGAPPRVGGQPGAGVDEDDVAAGGAQPGQQQAGQLGGGDEVGGERLLPDGGREVADRAEFDDSGDVEQGVEAVGQRLPVERGGEA